MTDTTEAQVIELVATAAEVSSDKVLLTSRLLHDLHIDGDDAVELFDAVHKRFGTDLTHLYERWRAHFGPEGIPLSAALIIVPSALAGGVIAAPLVDVTGNLVATTAGIAVTIALIVGSIWIARSFKLVKDVAPITVGEIVHAVEAGFWPSATP